MCFLWIMKGKTKNRFNKCKLQDFVKWQHFKFYGQPKTFENSETIQRFIKQMTLILKLCVFCHHAVYVQFSTKLMRLLVYIYIIRIICNVLVLSWVHVIIYTIWHEMYRTGLWQFESTWNVIISFSFEFCFSRFQGGFLLSSQMTIYSCFSFYLKGNLSNLQLQQQLSS